MPEMRDFDVEGIGYRKIKQTIQKEQLFDTFAKLTIQEIYVKTCRDEYSDKPILHSTSTVNCQRRVQWHVCIKCKIREF